MYKYLLPTDIRTTYLKRLLHFLSQNLTMETVAVAERRDPSAEDDLAWALGKGCGSL